MCVAILKEAHVELPSNTVMKRCWRKNSDGAGYAYLTDKDTWYVKKGFKKWKDLRDALDAENFKSEHTVLIHFRFGTSGKMIPNANGHMVITAPECNHPFPITDNEDKLNALEYEAENICCHNGTHSRPKGDLSDSQIAVRDLISPLMPYWKDTNIQNMCSRLLHGLFEKSNRWFIAIKDDYYMIGNWLLDKDTKLWYSNDQYKPTPIVPVPSVTVQSGKEVISTTIIKDAYEFMSASVWDWDKWKEFAEVAKPEDKSSVVDKSGEVNDDIDVLYDSSGKVIALIDKDGDIVWDDDVDKDDSWICPDCFAKQTIGDLIDGKCMYCLGNTGIICPICTNAIYDMKEGVCPWCHSTILDLEEQDVEQCPNCQEVEWVMKSTYDIGDSECLRCGALYTQLEIVGWNHDTKKSHADFMRMYMDKDEAEGF